MLVGRGIKPARVVGLQAIGRAAFVPLADSTLYLPTRLELVDALPRNQLGKILKNELRTRFDSAARI